MNLDPSETQALLRDTVRSYLEKEVPFDRVRRLERAAGWDEALWSELADQGWLAVPFAERLGGGGRWVDAGLLAEELARRACIVPILEVLVAGRALQDFAGPAGEALVQETLSAGALPVPALHESSARCEAGRLFGEARFVDYGAQASHHLVPVQGDEPALHLVDTAEPGVARRPLRSIGRWPVCAVVYDAAPARRVGGADAVTALARSGRALAAVQCVGSMQQALDMTVRYAGVREQFGRRIGSFQAVRHHCANMAMRVASARLLAYETLSALDRGVATDTQIALTKASASLAVPQVSMLAHQIHGGNGVIEENDLYFFTLRGKEHSLAWGTAEECLNEAADDVHEAQDWL